MSTESSSSSSFSYLLSLNRTDSDFTLSESSDEENVTLDREEGIPRFFVASVNEWSDVGSDIDYTPSNLFLSEADDYEAFFGCLVDSRREALEPEPLLISWKAKMPSLPPVEFLGKQGLKKHPREENPPGYFNLLADEEFLNTIISATNRNAARILSKGRPSRSRPFVWNELEIPEFKTFLGLLYLSGSEFERNWKPSEYFLRPIFPKTMSRDRFLSILKALSFTDMDAERTPEFRVNEIRYFIELIAFQMSVVYSPGKDLTVRTHCVFRSWNEKGMKLCLLTDSIGTVLDIHACFDCKEYESGKHSDETVMRILRPYYNMGYSVFVCKAYGSVRLAKLLASKSFNYTGKVSPKRDSNITEWLQQRLDNDDCRVLYTEDGVCCIKWREKWDEFWLSTEFDHKMIKDTNTASPSNRKALTPELVVSYYKNMSAADCFDWFHSQYEEGTYYIKLVVKLFSLFLHNANALHNKFSGKKIDLPQFRAEVIENLLDPEVTGVTSSITGGSHFPVEIDREGQCEYCFANGWSQNVHFICPNCPKVPFLCLKCFRPYHRTY